MIHGNRIRRGEIIGTGFISSIAATIRSSARVLYDDGSVDILTARGGVVAADYSLGSYVTERVALQDGWVTDAVTIVEGTPVPKRGQLYARMSIGPTQGGALCQDYIYELNPLVQGKFVDPGPGGGEGFKQWRLIVDNVTPIDVTEGLAQANTHRRYYGVAWYYNCAAEVANRSTVITVRKPGIARPTGFAAAFDIWKSTAFTMDTGQEGLVYAMKTVGGDGFSITNDNGVIAVDATTTAPVPFPLEVIEGDLTEMFFDVTNPHADDRHTIIVYPEEWMAI